MTILLTGAYGDLGRELSRHLTVIPLGHQDCDITNYRAVKKAIDFWTPDLVVHLAAEADVLRGESQKDLFYKVNVEGTRNVAQCAKNLIYFCTDYIFDGEKGNYTEYDAPNPLSFYALTKLLGESEARHASRCVSIRTSFKPRPYKHGQVPIEMYSTGGYIDDMAKEFVLAIGNFDKLPETLHIGIAKKRLIDLARETREVKEIHLADVPVKLPKDSSLDFGLWKRVRKRL